MGTSETGQGDLRWAAPAAFLILGAAAAAQLGPWGKPGPAAPPAPPGVDRALITGPVVSGYASIYRDTPSGDRRDANAWSVPWKVTGFPDGLAAGNDFGDSAGEPTAELRLGIPLTVPMGATVTAVDVDCTRWATGEGLRDYRVEVAFVDGAGTCYRSGNLANEGEWPTTGRSSTTYGGDSAALFGNRPVNAGGTSCLVTLVLRAHRPAGGVASDSRALVDAVRATVTYAGGSPPPR